MEDQRSGPPRQVLLLDPAGPPPVAEIRGRLGPTLERHHQRRAPGGNLTMSLFEWLYTIPLRARSIVRRPQVDRELDEELQFHLENHIAQLVAAGMDPGQARRRALLEFDGLERSKEECRDMRHLNLAEDFVKDAAYAARVLRKSPAFAC